MAGLGLGIGLNKKLQKGLSSAAQAGTASDWLGVHQGVGKKIRQAGIASGTTPQANAYTNLMMRNAQKAGAPVPGAPGTPPAPIAPAPSPATVQDPDWYSKFVSNYELPMPKELTAAGDYATKNLERLGSMPLPSYEEQFGTYKDLMERELEKQTADLTEAYGSRGGRYSSDLTTAAGTMRRQGLQDLSAQGITAMTNLNQQRMQELGGTMNVLQGVGTSRANMTQSAAQTAWQNYLMGTSPPEMMDKMLNWSAAFAPPGSVVTQK
jgi:hypothetical protein